MEDVSLIFEAPKTQEGAIPRPLIYSYHDYRTYLMDYIIHLRSLDPNFSLRALAKKSGLSAGYLPMFFSGNIGLTANALGKFLPFLGFSTEEKNHLKLLRLLAEAATTEERATTLNRILALRKQKGLTDDLFETSTYVSHWYFVAIRELAALTGFQWNAQWIKERLRFPVSTHDVEKAMEFLKARGWVLVSDSGQVKVTGPANLDCTGGAYRLALSKFHDDILSLTKEAIFKVPRSDRGIFGVTTRIPSGKVPELRAIILKAMEQIRELEDNSQRADSVYHVEFGLIPLAKIATPDKDQETPSAAPEDGSPKAQ